MRPPARAASSAWGDLLGCALDGKGTERCVFVANCLSRFVVRRIVSCHCRVKTLERVDDDAVLRRISVKGDCLAAPGKSFVPGAFTERLNRGRSKFLQKTVLILHIYLSNYVTDRLCLRVKTLDRSGTKYRTREH
jgi:hypothetical protein